MTPGIPLHLHVGMDYFNSLVYSEKIDCKTIIYVAGPFGAHLSRGGVTAAPYQLTPEGKLRRLDGEGGDFLPEKLLSRNVNRQGWAYEEQTDDVSFEALREWYKEPSVTASL